ncbi:alkaline phosphatase-like isoform X2 [Ruditapes philippinarum]|uniref:alkaline phosphatase-like isoform X2 n=1 Tax=Ruditapes philippinarum TaxID=129788 RepID=UPI00295B8F3B|nr:alkaline phosphatase-like isoform X2 [Ruditapes philippinarum]
MDTKVCLLYFIMLQTGLVLAAEYSYSANGETRKHWNDLANNELKKAKQMQPNLAVAKNVIVFLGDGMGVSTVTAARILQGQLKNKTGEEELLSFEHFPHVGLSKTYNQDAQTADSAGTATAYFSGIKTNFGLIGCDARARRGKCASMSEETKLKTILHWSQQAGKSVGLVTTTRVTHATPAALYAHTPERNWENDADIDDHVGNCTDIAAQLIDANIDIQVILGGGREKFLKNNTDDPQSGTITNGRTDGRDLIQEWQDKQKKLKRSYKYVWNNTAFKDINPAETEYLFGLFNKGHMKFEIERGNDEPHLKEMTEMAIKILSKNEKGFFLLVEGGRIDHAHHYGQAVRSLHDTLAFADAVQTGMSLTDTKDTLVITTADHSHTFTMGGYPTRGNPIFGFTDDRKGHALLAKDNKPFTTLNYANGPGGYAAIEPKVRPNLTNTNTADMNYRQQAGVPLESESHGGEDVAIYAQGPMAHLFHGVHEQHYIAHVMAYASCVGSYSSPNSCAEADVPITSNCGIIESNILILVLTTFLLCFL